jgi:uncharacterized repeat protein (TIGR01451 family)
VDGDGDMDVLSASYNDDKIAWYENIDGLGNFGAQVTISTNADGANSVYASDVDGNGSIDVLSTSRFDNSVVLYRNLGNLNSIIGNIKLDLDLNGCNSSDIDVSNVMITTTDGVNSNSTFTDNNGHYLIYVNEGAFNTSISALPSYFTSDPIMNTSVFTDLGNIDSADFCLEPTAVINDLNIGFYPLNDARPGIEAQYQVVFKNVGTTILDGAITISFDDVRLDFLTASEPVSSQTNNNVTFDYTNFKPFETRSIDVSFQVATPPTTQIDDILVYSTTITPTSGDLNEDDNTFILEQTVIGSHDPNDIQVLEGDSIYLNEADEYLHYIIRFQNTGTASAINVSVSNELDSNLDWNTLQIENISHANRIEIVDGNQLEFIFNNINLPDATTNEPESHGYIQYKIKPKNNIAVGDFMLNNAAIYFDFNPPVITNTVITTVIDNLGVEENTTNSISLYPVPATDILNIQSTAPIVDAKVFNNLGQLLFTVANPKGIEQLNIEQLSSGMYFVKLTDIQQNSSTRKFIK